MPKPKEIKVITPKSPTILLKKQLTIVLAAELTNNYFCENGLLENLDLAAVSAVSVSLDASRLIDVDLSGSLLKGLTLSDVAATKLNLANANLEEADWSRALIMGSRLTGFNLINSRLRDVVFKDCKIDLALFRFASLKYSV